MYCSDEIIPENEMSAIEFHKILKYGALWLVNRHQRQGYDSNPNPNEANYTFNSEDETWDTEAETTLETTLENDEISLPVMVECKESTNMALKSNQLNSVSSRKDLWIADSGASCHMTNSKYGMINLVKNNSEIKIGNGKTIQSNYIGQKRLIVIQDDGSTSNIILKECLYVPGLCTNLFSLTKAIQNNWQISNDGLKLKLTNRNDSLLFDQVLKTTNGYVNGVYMCHQAESANIMVTKNNDKQPVVDINDVHVTLGHINKDIIYKTAQNYNFRVKGNLKPCLACSLSKIKQRNIPKTTESKSTIPGERIFLDIASSRSPSFGGSNFWVLLVDDCADFCWSIFVRNKKDMSLQVVRLLKDLISNHKYNTKYVVKKIRCDNAGENKLLEQMSIDNLLGIKFEYISPGSPQFNGRVERKFAILFG
jgi:hypothetical protein